MALSWWLWLRGGGPGFPLPEGGLTVLVALAQGPGVQARGDCTALRVGCEAPLWQAASAERC